MDQGLGFLGWSLCELGTNRRLVSSLEPCSQLLSSHLAAFPGGISVTNPAMNVEIARGMLNKPLVLAKWKGTENVVLEEIWCVFQESGVPNPASLPAPPLNTFLTSDGRFWLHVFCFTVHDASKLILKFEEADCQHPGCYINETWST